MAVFVVHSTEPILNSAAKTVKDNVITAI